MELFHELKNKYILSTITLINRLYDEKSISALDFSDMLETGGSDIYTDLISSYPTFQKLPGMRFGLTVDAPLPIRPTTPEKIWLKSILANPRITLFLSSEERDMLLSQMTDIPDYSVFISSKSLANTPDLLSAEYLENFNLVLQAILEKRYLNFINQTPSGCYDNQGMIPYRLEYSIPEEMFRVSLWKDRPIKANLSRMSHITLGDVITDTVYAEVKEMVASRKASEPITLIVQNKNQAIERAAMLFSNCNRKSSPIYSEKGGVSALQLELEYYEFDEDEMIQKILSFGPRIKVLGNERIYNSIRRILE